MRVFLIALVVVMLGGCSFFKYLDAVRQDDKTSYDKPVELPALAVPSELSKNK